MKQETFTDIEYSFRKKKTKREEFLEIMDEIIPWDEWVDVIKPYYPKGKRGRPPMGIEKMLRMYLLQIWFNLSDPATEDAIYDRISDITISMKSADHIKMPELVNSRYMVRLDKKEYLRYVRMSQDLLLKLPKGEVTAANAAALSGKLTQMANGAVYSDDGDYEKIHDRKLDALEDIIESANGKPVLVAYWYQHDLDRIQERLTELKADFAKLDQERNIRRWNQGEIPVGLIHPASAGHGLNLQSGGNILVWFGLTWSLELYQQTVARLWRQGQKETVSVIHILAAKTIDEQIMRALETKDHTQKALIDAVRAEVMGHGDRQ